MRVKCKPMKKILLPTDFSEHSWNAIAYALQLFKKQECHFTLLNTYTPIIFQYEYMQSSSAQLDIVDAMKETSKKGLQRIAKKIKQEFNNPKHTFTQKSAFNMLVLEIEELYKQQTVDLIVMGTKGASGIKRVLLGSNAIHVIKNAKCPIMVVPSDFHFESPLEMLFPTDLEIDFQKKQLQPVIEIASAYHARIHVLHVSNGQKLTAKQETNRKTLEKQLKKVAHLFHIERHKNIPKAIAEFQTKSRINLLVMVNNKHSFFENLFFQPVIKQIGFHLNIPLWVIPTKA